MVTTNFPIRFLAKILKISFSRFQEQESYFRKYEIKS